MQIEQTDRLSKATKNKKYVGTAKCPVDNDYYLLSSNDPEVWIKYKLKWNAYSHQ